ncbi:hypothetical protein WJU23_13205 [Prosthecobacter sp. SYSU 5D2]|uniref:YfaP family protein n=1 Tax=Prosthecobacter sp. SYSU 5D2 TaxID=3134134 RepID=UPI0031FEE6FF
MYRPLRASCLNLAAAGLTGLAWMFSPVVADAAAPKPDHTITAGENYSEKIAFVKVDNAKVYYVSSASTYSARAVMKLGETDLSQADEKTHVDFTLGKLELHYLLGDDPKFAPGKKRARFVDKVLNEKGKPVSTRTLTVSWNKKTLTVSVRGATRSGQADAHPFLRADGFSGYPKGEISTSLSCLVIMGPMNGMYSSIPMKGKANTRTVTPKDKVPRTLTRAGLKGKGPGDLGAAPARGIAGTDTVLDSEPVDPNAGNTLEVETGPLAGLRVVVPAGAIPSPSTFSLARNSMTLVPNSGRYPGHTINIKTDGATDFNEPLQITVPIEDDDSLIPVPYYIDENGFLQVCQIISIDRNADTMTFETFHASFFTWIYEQFAGVGEFAGATDFLGSRDGFQVVNVSSVYNPGGECFGMAAFAQWHYTNAGGGLFDRYMENLPLPPPRVSVIAQQVIATRAHTSMSRVWNEYVPGIQQRQNLGGAEKYAAIKNVLENTARPTILYLYSAASHNGAHAVLATDHNNSRHLKINDPNLPGQEPSAEVGALGSLTYGDYAGVCLIGDGSFQKEPLREIYRDAENGFGGNAAAQINITSHSDGATVTDRTVVVSGQILSGQMLVARLEMVLNGTTTFETDVSSTGFFSVPISLVSGSNRLTFRTKGYNGDDQLVDVPNTQLLPFELLYENSAAILVTLSWNTDDTDLDLYVIDPQGDYSAYYNKVTADGGELDYDDTNGFGPEHWTLDTSDTVRWGQPYQVRTHYYSDHGRGGTTTLPTRWTVTVLLYEGTPRAQTFTYTGVLAYDNSSNNGPLSTGADWADVCTVTPVETSEALGIARVRMSARGIPDIVVPVPSLEQQAAIKEAGRHLPR